MRSVKSLGIVISGYIINSLIITDARCKHEGYQQRKFVNQARFLSSPVFKPKNFLFQIKTLKEHQMCVAFESRQRWKKKYGRYGHRTETFATHSRTLTLRHCDKVLFTF